MWGTGTATERSATGAWADPGKSGKQPTTAVWEGWVQDAGGVVSATPTSDPDVYTVTYAGGSIYECDFTGHTMFRAEGATLNVKTGGSSADYTETFYGTCTAGLRSTPAVGLLTFKGHFEVTQDLTFLATADIVGGTCGFTSSSGSLAYNGFMANVGNGGYVGSWTQPAGAAPEPRELCTPAAPPHG